MLSRTEIRDRLIGPIASIRTIFHQDGSIDFGGLRNYIDFVINAGSKALLLTVGDSHYNCLSDEEIAEVTKITCKHTAGRAMVVAADRYHSTSRAVDFACFAKGLGADVVMCLPPDWGDSCTPETMVEHYVTVAQYMPVMIVTNVFIPRGSDFGLKTIDMALDKSDNIVAVKDDMCGDFAPKLCLMAHDRCAIFAGGMKVNHMNMYPYGCDGYLSTFIAFKPDVTHNYWKAIISGNLKTASGIINDFDIPYFDFIDSLPGGFDAGIHGTLELAGIAKRYRRPPYRSLTDEEMEKLKEFMKSKGLL